MIQMQQTNLQRPNPKTLYLTKQIPSWVIDLAKMVSLSLTWLKIQRAGSTMDI